MSDPVKFQTPAHDQVAQLQDEYQQRLAQGRNLDLQLEMLTTQIAENKTRMKVLEGFTEGVQYGGAMAQEVVAQKAVDDAAAAAAAITTGEQADPDNLSSGQEAKAPPAEGPDFP